MQHLHCGLELRHNLIFATLVTDQGTLVIKKTLPNNLDALLAFLEPYRLQLDDVVMEETENWRMLAGPLAEHGFHTTVI
jgi:hypothetical protein